MSHASAMAIGIDVGGTAIKYGLVGANGTIIEKGSIDTGAEVGVEHVIGRLVDLIRKMRDRAAAMGTSTPRVGLGMPGTISHRTGVVIAPPNLPGWRNVPIVERLKKDTGLAVSLENDANCAAVAEFRMGAGRGSRSMVMLTLGTGVGSGLILDGRLWRGATDGAGEIGHLIVQIGGRRCNCGQLGCLEAYASASSTALRAQERVKAGERSSLSDVSAKNGTFTAEDVAEAARAGDSLAKSVWEESCRFLAAECLNIQRSLDPNLIVLGGGMGGAGDFLITSVRRAMAELGSPTWGPAIELRLAEMGNDAGMIGAALVANDE